MSLKAFKSKSLVLTNRKVNPVVKLYFSTSHVWELIPTISSNPVTFLGHPISFDLADQVQTSLSLIDKSNIEGLIKLRCRNVFLYPIPLLIHEIAISTFSGFEQKILLPF